MRPASAVPVYCDLARLAALCEALEESPPGSPTPWTGWRDFCRWAVAQPDPLAWRPAMASFVRWQGARDDALIHGLRGRGAASSLRRAWVLALSRSEGALFAGWASLRCGAQAAARFTDSRGHSRSYLALHDADGAYTAVLSGPGLLDDVDACRRRIDRLYAGEPTPVLLVARMDRSRTLTPVLAAVGAT